MITRELIEKRMAEAKAAQEQFIAQINMCIGVIKDCEHWLEVLNTPERRAPETEAEDEQ